MTAMASAPMSKLFPMLLSILSHFNVVIKTDGDGQLTLLQASLTPLSNNTSLDTRLDTISFTLFTRENPTDGEILKLDDLESVRNSHWNASKETIMIVHGWSNSGLSEVCTSIRDAFLQVRDCNVIVVDWSEVAEDAIYFAVVEILPRVAKCVTNFINFMQIEAGLRTSNLKLIGHSLGSHIMGLSAQEVGKSSRVAEIIALDPAKPLLQSKGPNERIDESDAQNVQAIHTCAGTLGMDNSIGTSDFFANDGTHQPGCGDENWFGMCSHVRSYKLFAESIRNPKGFIGTREDGATAYMGGATLDPKAKGTYYFKTKDQSPYALGG